MPSVFFLVQQVGHSAHVQASSRNKLRLLFLADLAFLHSGWLLTQHRFFTSGISHEIFRSKTGTSPALPMPKRDETALTTKFDCLHYRCNAKTLKPRPSFKRPLFTKTMHGFKLMEHFTSKEITSLPTDRAQTQGILFQNSQKECSKQSRRWHWVCTGTAGLIPTRTESRR